MEWVASTLHTTSEHGVSSIIALSEPEVTRWRTGGEVKGKHASGVGSQLSCTLPQNMVYPALLPLLLLMRTPRLPVVDWTDPPPPTRRFKWNRPFRWKTKSGFCAWVITFRTCYTTADVHTSAASSRLNWRPCRFKWTRPFRRKTKCGFCACAITFQTSLLQNVWSALPFRVWQVVTNEKKRGYNSF